MNNYSKIYWLTRLDNIIDVSIFLTVISLMGILFIIIFTEMGKDMDSCYPENEVIERKKSRQNYSGKIKYLVIVAILSGICGVFLPTQKEAIMIIAGGKTMDFIQKDTSVRKIPHQTTEYISEYLDKQIKELSKEAK